MDVLQMISPIDGRYRRVTEPLALYFSEFALFHYRTRVEVEYFISLCELPLPQLSDFDKSKFEELRNIYRNFSLNDSAVIKEIEKTTNHDVKAVEYFIKNRFDKLNLTKYKEFIHFGLTSQDINNTAIPLLVKEAVENVIKPELDKLIDLLSDLSDQWRHIPMLARTHGQPASPTRLGKEIQVFIERLTNQLTQLESTPFSAKFGGATGNFNAHHVAYPTIDWISFANQFVKQKLGLQRQQVTTQIEHYDDFAALCDSFKRINTILIDLNRDMWTYISLDYFKQKIKPDEVGSSAMPHKVNPIDFENSEGNLGIANAVFEHLATKLPISRLQRDLTDSTVLRNVGVPFAHTFIAFKSIQKGLGKLLINQEKIHRDLENNWAVVSEAIQTILRRESYPNPYEALKALTRTNTTINEEAIQEFVQQLNVSEDVKKELLKVTPHNYTGIEL